LTQNTVDLKNFRMSKGVFAVLAFVVALCIFVLVAWLSAVSIESRSAAAVNSRLLSEGYTWASVEANGLQVVLTGTAPNEAARFRAVNLAGAEVESTRVRDQFDVTPAAATQAPRFSIEMLRNDDGIQLIGLLPEGDDRKILTDAAAALVATTGLSDMLETADYPAPETWDKAFDFGLQALKALPRAKISVWADGVAVTAIARSDQEKRDFELVLSSKRPSGITLSIDVTAPRPVLTPFTLRFVKDATGARFDACSADSERAKAQIKAAATAAGAVVDATACIVGLGVPSPSWSAATAAGINAVAALGDATVTFSDADVTLEAGQSVTQANFDRALGEFRSALPDVFSLDAKLTEKAASQPAGPIEFTAVLAGDTGRIELRGRLGDERGQEATESLAKALFGSSKVYLATRLDPNVPDGWPVRVIAGLDSLAELSQGTLLVRPDLVEVKGVTGSTLARAKISQILSDQLGKGQTFRVSVQYDKALDPLASLPTQAECNDNAQAVLAANKISFPPGSAAIDGEASKIIALIAKALDKCGPIKFKIAGHTDAQGSEGGNLALSQARAKAVLVALQGRQVDVSGMVAEGYGEGTPIADNGTEEGREANRRIEFAFMGQYTIIGGNSPAERSAKAAAGAATQAPETKAEEVKDAVSDFSDDTSPSVAPEEKTIAPQERPAQQEG
jgi:OOP family OmpA-OmpF porin